MKKLATIITVCIALLYSLNGYSADYYWVNGTGNWSEFATHWATSSGGAIFHLQAPTQNDDVYFDANSFSVPLEIVTIDVEAFCHNIDWTGVTNNPDLAGSFLLNIYGSLIFDPNMTSSFSSGYYFKSSGAGNTIDVSTVLLSTWGFEFSGSGEWTVISDLILPMGTFTVTGGTVNLNNITITVSNFQSWPNIYPREINMGNSTINCMMMNIWDSSSLTFNAGTSTINTENNWFDGQGFTYYDVNFPMSWSGEVMIRGNNTFHTLGFNYTNVTGVAFESGDVQTVFDINFGATCSFRKMVRSSIQGETATIKKNTGTVHQDYLNIRDIEVIGGANFITDNGMDLGNVINWTINSVAGTTLYWVGGTGNWSEPDHWSTISGGPYPSGNTCVPGNVDNVVFDLNSFSVAGEIVTIDVDAFCNNITWVGVMNNPTFANTWKSLYVSGSFTLDPNMTTSLNGSIWFISSGVGNTITSAGKNIDAYMYFDGGGDWQLLDPLTSTQSINFDYGTFTTNDHDMTIYSFYSDTDYIRNINLGTSTVTCTYGWSVYDNANLTLSAAFSHIIIGGYYFYGADQAYNNLTLNNTAYTYIYGSNSFNIINDVGNCDINFQDNGTTIFNDLIVTGSCADLIQIKSTTQDETAFLQKTAGVVTIDLVILKDIAAIGGATFNANNCVDGGNVAGWVITPLASVNYYWIGGGGNWSDPLNWSLISGGPANPGGCIPTQVDNVFFDANSGLNVQTVSIDVIAYCNNMDWTGATNARIGGSIAIYIYGSMIFNNSMIINHTGNTYFVSENSGNFINTAGRTIRGHVYFNGNGDWTLQGNLTTQVSNSKNIYFDNGTLLTNNFTVTTNMFYSYSTSTRNINMGASIFDVNTWYIFDGTNMTITPGTSTINVSSGNSFYGGDLTYNNVNISTTGSTSIYGSNTFNILNIPSCSYLNIEGGTFQTFTSIIFPDGTGCGDYFDLGSSIAGMPAAFNMPAGILTKNWVRITDIMAGGGTFNANNSIGIGNTTGWNITSIPGTDYYWITDGGDWNDPLHWSLVSGGTANPTSCIPGPNDNVYFDTNSFLLASQIVNINVEAFCKNMDWTGVSNNPELSGWNIININGSLIFDPSIVMSYGGTINFVSSDPGNTIFTSGLTISGVSFSCSGDYTLLGDLNLQWGGVTYGSGTLNTNNYDIFCPNGSFWSSTLNFRTLNLGSSYLEFQGWDIQDGTNFTLIPGSSQIHINNNGWIFRGAGLTYYDVLIDGNTWGSINIYGSNTYNMLYFAPGAQLIFEEGTTHTTADLLATGNPGNMITFESTVPGNEFHIIQSTHEFCGNWMRIKDSDASGTTFYAGENSIDLGNTSGWTWGGVTANDQYSNALCEDVHDGGTVAGNDLTAWEPAIDGGNGYIHTWYQDAALSILVATPANVIVSDGMIFYDEVFNGICTNVAEVTYSVVSTPATSFLVTDVLCYGNNTGAIDLTVLGGTTPFTFEWSNSETTEDIGSLTAATYTVTVIDNNSCLVVDNSTVGEPFILTIDTENYTNVTCNGDNDGTINITASGGTGVLSYDIGAGAQPSGNFSGLSGGIYTVTVTDANLCTATSSAFTITDPVAISIDSEASTDITCNSDNDGTITITASGGTGVLSYDIGSGAQPSGNFSGLSGGIYTVTVTDANLCTATSSAFTITDPAVISIDSEASTDITCNGDNNGTITITASGGTGALTYDIGLGGQATGNFIGLSGGIYTVTVTDINLCTATSSAITITDPPALALS
ncbi:MAG: SprB repeat-containing protein, partial [Bacteroidota bacterium]